MHQTLRLFIVGGCALAVLACTSCSTPDPGEPSPTPTPQAMSSSARPTSTPTPTPTEPETTTPPAETTSAAPATTQDHLQDIVDGFRHQLPMIMDSDSTLVSVSAPGGDVLRYEYVLTTVTSADLTEEEAVAMTGRLRTALYTGLAGSPDTAVFREMGVTLVYAYVASDAPRDFANAPVTITFTPADLA